MESYEYTGALPTLYGKMSKGATIRNVKRYDNEITFILKLGNTCWEYYLAPKKFIEGVPWPENDR